MENKMEYFVFFSIVAAIGGLIWYTTRWFLKKEAEIIAKDNAAQELVKSELQKIRENIAAKVIAKAAADAEAEAIKQKAIEAEKEIVQAAVTEVRPVKTRVTKRKAKK